MNLRRTAGTVVRIVTERLGFTKPELPAEVLLPATSVIEDAAAQQRTSRTWDATDIGRGETMWYVEVLSAAEEFNSARESAEADLTQRDDQRVSELSDARQALSSAAQRQSNARDEISRLRAQIKRLVTSCKAAVVRNIEFSDDKSAFETLMDVVMHAVSLRKRDRSGNPIDLGATQRRIAEIEGQMAAPRAEKRMVSGWKALVNGIVNLLIFALGAIDGMLFGFFAGVSSGVITVEDSGYNVDPVGLGLIFGAGPMIVMIVGYLVIPRVISWFFDDVDADARRARTMSIVRWTLLAVLSVGVLTQAGIEGYGYHQTALQKAADMARAGMQSAGTVAAAFYYLMGAVFCMMFYLSKAAITVASGLAERNKKMAAQALRTELAELRQRVQDIEEGVQRLFEEVGGDPNLRAAKAAADEEFDARIELRDATEALEVLNESIRLLSQPCRLSVEASDALVAMRERAIRLKDEAIALIMGDGGPDPLGMPDPQEAGARQRGN